MNDIKMKNFMTSVLNSNGFNVNRDILKFSTGNGKLNDIITFSMPAGHSCPFAKDCRSCTTLKNSRSVNSKSKKVKFSGFGIQDGPHTQFRCFTAIDEVLRPAVRLARWHNFLLLLTATTKGKESTVKLIERSLPEVKWNKPTRIHVAGDFFNQTYFDAWLDVCRNHPSRIFYAYTKALPLWIKRLNKIPINLKLTASYGGSHDHLITKHNLKFAKVVESLEEAKTLGLECDHDDSHAYGSDISFALLVHGTQPAGSKMSVAWTKLKKIGMGGYGKTIKMGGYGKTIKMTRDALAKSISAGGTS